MSRAAVLYFVNLLLALQSLLYCVDGADMRSKHDRVSIEIRMPLHGRHSCMCTCRWPSKQQSTVDYMSMHVSYHSPNLPIRSVVCQSSDMRLGKCTRRLLRHRPPLRHPSPPVVSTVCSSGAVKAAATTTALSHLATEAHAPQGKRWDKVQRWVMFSDLHVSVRTLDTCISVLQTIKKEATSRKAGILFLGEYIMPECCIACSMIRVKHQSPLKPMCCKVCHIPCQQH